MSLIDEEIDKKVQAMNKARIAKNYEVSDALREELYEQGIEIKMARTGVKWPREE